MSHLYGDIDLLRAAFRAVPEDLLQIPTDTMKIRADIFERELFISLV